MLQRQNLYMACKIVYCFICCKDKTSTWYINGSHIQRIGCQPDKIHSFVLVFFLQFFFFSFFSVQGGNSTDVEIHSPEVKMYSVDVKIQVKFRDQQTAT